MTNQISSAQDFNWLFSILHLVCGGLLMMMAWPFLNFLIQWTKFRCSPQFTQMKLLPRASKTASKDIRENVPVESEIRWLRENDSTMITWENEVGMLDLYIADSKALSYVLGTSAYRFEPTLVAIRVMRNLIGEGLVTTTGEAHQAMRKATNPAFQLENLKLLTPIFFQCSKKMIKCLEADSGLNSYAAKNGKIVDIDKYLGRATLDVIGLAGFGYDYNSLDSGSRNGSRLSEAIASAVRSFQPSVWMQRWLTAPAVQNAFPVLGDLALVARNRNIASARKEMDKVAEEIVALKLQKVKQEMAAEGEAKLSKDSRALKGSDILDFLIRASLTSDAKSKLGVKHLAPQLATWTFAGAETTATMLGSLMVHLGNNVAYQRRLQEELDEFYDSLPEEVEPDWDQVDSLPFLSYLISETLRVSPPVPAVHRTPVEDAIVPLSKPIVDQNGNKISQILVPKGTSIFLGVGANNRLKEIWGEDADEFKPDRWAHLPQSHSDAHLGINHHWSFSGGPKICIGSKFALMEAKCIVATFFRAYDVELVADMTWRQFLVNRICIKGREHEGPQCPVRIIPRSSQA